MCVGNLVVDPVARRLPPLFLPLLEDNTGVLVSSVPCVPPIVHARSVAIAVAVLAASSAPTSTTATATTTGCTTGSTLAATAIVSVSAGSMSGASSHPTHVSPESLPVTADRVSSRNARSDRGACPIISTSTMCGQERVCVKLCSRPSRPAHSTSCPHSVWGSRRSAIMSGNGSIEIKQLIVQSFVHRLLHAENNAPDDSPIGLGCRQPAVNLFEKLKIPVEMQQKAIEPMSFRRQRSSAMV